jgi:hypothetical protein
MQQHSLTTFLREYGSDMIPLPKIAGTYAGRKLAVCGDGIGIWEDLEALGFRCDVGRGRVEREGWDILTVNKLVEVMPAKIEHAYSNEPMLLNKFIAARRCEYGHEFGGPKHTHSHSQGAQHRWPFGGHGTSGLGGALVGVGLGYDAVVICGMPLDDGPHNGEPPWRRTAFKSSEAAGGVRTGRDAHWWRAKELAFQGKVTSMSGRTREWLGAPNL